MGTDINISKLVKLKSIIKIAEETEIIKEFSKTKGVLCAVSEQYEKGGEGTTELAEKVAGISDHNKRFQPLYNLDSPVEEKIEIVCREIYGSKSVDFTKKAKSDLRIIKRLGLEQLPICIAKTQKSLSDNPKLLGRPKDFLVTVREIKISSGAGFLVPITGNVLLMPGLPKVPVAECVDIDDNGNITGLF